MVSVLISLISDTWANGSHDTKFIFLGGGFISQHLAAGVLERISHFRQGTHLFEGSLIQYKFAVFGFA